MKIGIIENFKECVTKKYFKFSGRASRQEYWKFILVYIGIGVILRIINFILGYSNAGIIFSMITGLYGLLMLIPGIAAGVRRLHDINRSGWTLIYPISAMLIGMLIASILGEIVAILTVIIYFALLIYLIFLLAKPGILGPNMYGEDPYAEDENSFYDEEDIEDIEFIEKEIEEE